MRPSRTLATAARVLRQLSHDHRSMAMLLLAPSLLIGLFAWLFDGAGAVDGTRVFDRIGPIVLAIFPFILMFLITSITTLRERRTGTLERLLTTPIGRGDLVLGYALAFALAAAAQAIVAVAFAVGVCGLAVDGPLWLLGAVAVLDAVLGVALGLFASAFATTEFQAVQLMPVLVFPQLILVGVFMPRDAMPDALSAISDWLPLSYAVDGMTAVVRDDLDALTTPVLVLLGFTVAFLVLGALTLRRRTP